MLLELLTLKLQSFTKYLRQTLVSCEIAHYIRKFKGKENLVKHQKVSEYYEHDCGLPLGNKKQFLMIFGDTFSMIFGDNFKNIC